jgi:HEAT repeat protein
MRKALFFVLCFALVAGPLLAADHKAKEQELIKIVESDAPKKDKAIPIKQLTIYGSEACVPALAKLLSDPELASWARIPLEAIPGTAPDDALRYAASTLDGRLLIGAINSIGVRRDPKAIDILAGKLGDPDPGVGRAAAEALGRIGGAKAIAVLEPALKTTKDSVRSAVALGCVYCAERLDAEGKSAEAVKLYDTIRKADVPQQRIIEGTRGAILARGNDGIPLLVEQLNSEDKAFFRLGLRVARELPGPEATMAVVGEMNKAPEARKMMLIIALAERGDRKALPAVLAAAKSGSAAVRVAALEALEDLGDASCIGVLLDAAVEADAAVAKAATTTLARLPGDDVEAAMAAMLPKAEPKARQVLAALVGQRRIEAALPALVESTSHADAGVRVAAVAAIGVMGSDKQAPDLVKAVQKTQDAKERGAIEKALVGISSRGKAACVPHLLPLAKSDSAAVRVVGLHALAAAGGPEALAAVKAALGDKESGVQDEAVRTLSTWPNKWPEDDAVLEPLVGLVKSQKKNHQILALRGVLQYLQGTKKLNDAAKMAKLDEVLPMIERPEEKRLAISVLGTIGTAGSLEKLSAYAGDKGLAEEASSAIVNLVGRRGGVKGVPKEKLREALLTAAGQARSGRTKKRAQDLLKRIK